MAISEGCPGLKVEILDGTITPLPEYNNVDADSNTKYIEARSGSVFSIRASFTSSFMYNHHVLMDVTIDGKRINANIIETDRLTRCSTRRIRHVMDGIHIEKYSKWYLQPFRFSELEIDKGWSGSDDASDAQDMSQIGTISVSFLFIQNIRWQPFKGERSGALSKLSKISEGALKADPRSHQVTFSKPIAIKGDPPVLCPQFDLVGRRPFATFTFKYRSLAALKALHIIPSHPSSKSLERRLENGLIRIDVPALLEQYRARTQFTTSTKPIKRQYDYMLDHSDYKYSAIRADSSPSKRSRIEPPYLLEPIASMEAQKYDLEDPIMSSDTYFMLSV
ncbi:hypothetical protein P153DRAFT_61109 [Dothidotthia symphoricarpi CBS 119687]|uniref:DUF7918 domain-containing protein n=1 Tax=Dothidotthia symphoricarpi CBS 119687 TaxID=1392245 RepID=A0A6A6A7Y1_9PLEO|nr:uncharacterized protein P153DRAFT_61109 [Dothidotthia symphoricarpi CBS 119687]KAF2127184.1 hypothetical protein P153DRAFT_61109 [Dothidotthia symphoricarpi CBS 119687]